MRYLSFTATAAALACAGLLAACGGSSGGSTPDPTPSGGGTTGITLTGVVAKGAALANATVVAKCASGTASATTNANGGYTLTFTGALPCVLGATSSDGLLVLHSVAPGAAGTTAATANITTLTELLVAQLTGQAPTAYMANVAVGTLSATVTTATLGTAQTAVLSTLSAAGIDTAALGNLVSGTLVPASGGSAGNGYDQALDALAAALATGGSSLAELTATVATASPASGSTTVAQSSSLPADLLLKPKASNCAALRSTDYRILKVAPSVTTGATDPYTATETMSFDATTLIGTFANDSMEWSNGSGPCHFTSGTADMVVSPSGVIVVRNLVGADDDTTSDGGKVRMLIGLPVQDIAVADLADTWSVVNWDLLDGVYKPSTGIITIAANGTTSASKCFENPLNTSEAACTTEPLPPTFSANANGGFTLTSTDPTDVWTSRAFAYRGGSGDLLVVLIDAGGNLGLATKYRTLALPTVGTVSVSWNLAIDSKLVATDALSTTTNTITGVSGNVVTRNSQNGTNAYTTPQQLTYNSPRNGLWTRTGQSAVTNSDGTTGTVREGYFLRLAGMGITAYALPSNVNAPANNARLGLSVNQ
jgi:hypothetical protein